MAGYFTTARLSNCSFQGNRAKQGGGLFAIAFAAPRLVNATLAGNFALQEGGGLSAFILSGVELENSILWGNLPQELSGLEPLLDHVCLFGGTDGGGNLALDPLFLRSPQAGPDGEWATDDDLRGDLRLSAGSPCRDAGDNALLLPGEDLDLDGNPRCVDDPWVLDSGAGLAPLVDLGAYEAGPGN
jgi:hypothetical protein